MPSKSNLAFERIVHYLHTSESVSPHSGAGPSGDTSQWHAGMSQVQEAILIGLCLSRFGEIETRLYDAIMSRIESSSPGSLCQSRVSAAVLNPRLKRLGQPTDERCWWHQGQQMYTTYPYGKIHELQSITPHSPYKKSKSLISGGLSFGSTVF